MKLQPDRTDVQTITSYGDGWVAVNGERVDGSVIVGSAGQRVHWPCRSFVELAPADFELLAQQHCELVVFGSGERLRFVPAAWLRPLIERRIGLETMDTRAACRTYNILAAEGRSVVAALLVE